MSESARIAGELAAGLADDYVARLREAECYSVCVEYVWSFNRKTYNIKDTLPTIYNIDSANLLELLYLYSAGLPDITLKCHYGEHRPPYAAINAAIRLLEAEKSNS